jgi:hypothetical protein
MAVIHVNAKTLEPVGYCIYCGATESADRQLKREHVIPAFLGAHTILPKASCGECEKITSYIEGHCANNIFKNYRFAFKIHSGRRKKLKKTHMPVTAVYGGREQQKLVDAANHPGGLVLPVFRSPGLVEGRSPTAPFGRTVVRSIQDVGRQNRAMEYVNKEGAETFFQDYSFNFTVYGRFLAKLAHVSAFADKPNRNFKPYLPPIILKNDPTTFFYVGGEIELQPVPSDRGPKEAYRISLMRHNVKGKDLLISHIRLFFGNPPHCILYYVVVGELPNDASATSFV